MKSFLDQLVRALYLKKFIDQEKTKVEKLRLDLIQDLIEKGKMPTIPWRKTFPLELFT